MPKILLVQGANLTFLGRREPAIFGRTTPAELDAMLQRHTSERGYALEILGCHLRIVIPAEREAREPEP